MILHIRNKRFKLVQKAVKKFGKIYPTSPDKNLMDGFTVEKNHLYFWFNTLDGSTHLVGEKRKSLI